MKLLTIAYYMLSSILAQSANKALFTVWGFNYPVLVALTQMSVTSIVCYVASRPAISLRTTANVVPLAVVNVCNVVAGLIGTGGLNVPMFISLRRFSLVTTILCEWALYKKLQAGRTIAHVLVMVAGGLLAAVNDLSFNAAGYIAVLLNNLCTSTYLVLMKHINHDLTSTGLLFYNSLLSFPALLTVLVFTEEAWAWRSFPEISNPAFLSVFACSGVMGLFVNHGTFLCTRCNEPLTTSVAGSFKNIFMTFLGMYAFGDFVFQKWNFIGLSISLVGSCMYAYDKAFSSANNQQPAAASKSNRQ